MSASMSTLAEDLLDSSPVTLVLIAVVGARCCDAVYRESARFLAASPFAHCARSAALPATSQRSTACNVNCLNV